MANLLYPATKEGLLGGDIALDTDTVKVVLVDTADYTYAAAHTFLSDVPAAARVATSAALTGKTITGGTFDSADPVFTAAAGDVSEALILYIDTGTATTSRLLCYLDTGIGGMPVTPNGGDITVQVNAAGWLSL